MSSRSRCACRAGTRDDPMKNFVYGVSRVHTDAGVTGTAFLPCPQDILQRWVKPTLVGEDVFAIDRHVKQTAGLARRIRGPDLVRRGARDVGCGGQDRESSRGQAAGRLAGRLRVYRTTVWPYSEAALAKKPLLESDQQEIPYDTQAKFAVRLKENGFTGMKIRAWRPKPMDDVDAVGAIRAAVGPDFKIMLDRTAVRPGWVWDYPTALEVCRGLEKHDAYWLEEPFDGHDIYGPARLAAEVDILITGGELAKSTYEFLEFLVNKTYDVLQPDTRICGGIWMARKIAVLAESFGVPCIQHGTSSLALAGYIQAGCAMNNCEWQEIIGGPNLPQEQWEPGAETGANAGCVPDRERLRAAARSAGTGPGCERRCHQGVSRACLDLTRRSLLGMAAGSAALARCMPR